MFLIKIPILRISARNVSYGHHSVQTICTAWVRDGAALISTPPVCLIATGATVETAVVVIVLVVGPSITTGEDPAAMVLIFFTAGVGC